MATGYWRWHRSLAAFLLIAQEYDCSVSSNSIRSICATPESISYDLQRTGLPDIVAVNWGQWHGPYSLPLERLVVCADGRSVLWKQAERPFEHVPNSTSLPTVSVRTIGPSELKHFFQLILTEWPQGSLERKGEEGKYIWLLDSDFNFIVAPIMQARGPDRAIEEVKHGDLCPGTTFFGDDVASGPYRGVARFGGEFNLAGLRDGKEWIMHAKSGYTAYRVPVEKARSYFDAMRSEGRHDEEIARNFQRCVFKDIFRGRMPLTSLLCYLRRQFDIDLALGVTQQCDIRTKAIAGLPNLADCFPKDSGDSPLCSGEVSAGAPIVHLVDWYAIGQDRCNFTMVEYDALLQDVGDNIRTFLAYNPSVASSSGGRAYAKSVSKKLRSLRKHSCLYNETFTQGLHCNIHGCFGEGITQHFKRVESSLGGVRSDRKDLEMLWRKAMLMWGRCKSPRVSDEL